MEWALEAARRAKRMRPETPMSPEAAASSCGSCSLGGAGRYDEPYVQGPPPAGPAAAGEGGDGVDRISALGDGILRRVVSLLPTKDGARTRVLATRWRHLWRSAPLNLDAGALGSVGAVSRVLAAHQGPGRRFRFASELLQSHPAAVDAWLRSPALDDLQEIDCRIDEVWGWHEFRQPPLPASAFRFSASLCVATLSECHVSDDVAGQGLQFPSLKKLALQWIAISKDSLHRIIAASPVLECLLLCTVIGVRSVKINSASLTSIGMGHGDDGMSSKILEELVIEDAPRLKRIVYHRQPKEMIMAMQVSVISAPNLDTVGCLNYSDYCSWFSLGETCIAPHDMMEFQIRSTAPACTIKILSVNINGLNLDDIIEFMKCFPCLEKLYIQASRGRDQNLWRRKHQNLLKSLDIRLKTVVLNNYRGIKAQVNFATFFLLNAKMLESMVFHCERDSVTNSFLAEQHQMLQVEKRASRCARVYFTTKRCEHDFMHINHVHDLSKTDPFECEGSGRRMRIV